MASDPRADAHAMLALLAQSMGAQEPLRSQAEKQLEALQQQPLSAAFIAAVCEQIAISPDGNNATTVAQLDGNLRLLASIWLKHFAKRSWKSSRHWSDADRVHLRRVLLAAALQEPHTPIATQLALVVATVARGDFPAQWTVDQLFAPMMQTLQDANTSVLQQRRCLDVMYRLVKELATRRLLMHRKQFAMLSLDLLPLALQYWGITARGTEFSTENDRLAMLLTSTKLIATLLLNAFRDLAMLQNGDVVRATLERFFEHLDQFVALQQPRAETLDKLCYRMAQLIVGVQKAYPIEFRSYLTPFLSLFWKIILVPVDTQVSAAQQPSPRLQIRAIQFITNVVNCKLYQRESLSTDSSSVVAKVITATGDVNLTDAMVLEANAAVLAFLEPNVEKLLQSIVLHYMVLTQNDLDEWQSDPEAFAVLSESLTAEESVRACAENLFLTLLQTYPTQTLPVLTQLTAAATTWLAEGSHALQADAVLLAIGLGCYDLHDCFEFEPWFLQHLVPLLQADASAADVPVLQYRVVWLVSCWLAQLSAAVTAPLYDALLQVASRATDAALRLRVVQTLEAMLGDWGFQSQVFAPYLPRALASLYAFFPDTHASESKLAVLGCVEAMLQACDADMIVGVSEQVSAPLPTMWQSGGEAENLVRGKILSLLARLLSCVKTADAAVIAANGAQLHTLHGMCLQVVQFATDVSNPDQVFLMESGLELWLETLTIAPAYGEELHVLFGNAVRLLERDYEHVKLVLTLLEQYVNVGGARFWQDYHSSVGVLLASVVGGVKSEASLQLARVVERIVAVFPAEQLGSLADVLGKMVDACVAYSRRLSDDGTSVVAVEPESVVVAYLSVVARLLMQHCVWFAREVLARHDGGAGVLVTVVVLMLDKFFGVVAASMSLRRRKMWAIGLCAVVDLVGDVPTLLESVGQIIESCVDVMDDEREMKRDAGNGQDGQGAEEDGEDEEEGHASGAYRAYKSYRKQKLVRQQQEENGEAAVDSLDLRQLIRGKLAAVAATVGADVFAQVMQSVDASALAKLQ